MRIVFMGTPEFAVSSLEALYESGQDVVLAVTQPDRPKGRGYVLTPSPVKVCALEHGTEVITPEKMRDESVLETLKNAKADMFVVTAFGKILPQSVLDIPPMGCVNVHASLLPKLRGAAPINRAVMNGDTSGGITLMYMDAGMDTGDIISEHETEIPADWDAGDYHDALMEMSKSALKGFIELCESGKSIPRKKQDDGEATYAPKITGEDTLLDFGADCVSVCNRIRSLAPAPCAYFLLCGKRIKVRKAIVSDGSGKPGEVISCDRGGIEIACGKGSVIIKSLCPEGKSLTDAESYLRGHRLAAGTIANGR
ncbi:MAG: methionyl-tRNA formyltransferase [Clostridia bacterium]|nr:methionyl-tRNA formyltransferase [Clostridia bacterium]